jgi:hypothetical protein
MNLAFTFPRLIRLCSSSIKEVLLFIFLVYVDDIIVVSSDAAAVDKLLDKLRSDFALKDLGSLNYFLGIKVSTLSSGLLLTQRKYAQELILKAGLKDCKATPTPLSI